MLKPCNECNRHIRVAESRCPFCDAVNGARGAPLEPLRMPSARLGSAAIYTFRATVAATALTACGGQVERADQSTDAASQGEPGTAGGSATMTETTATGAPSTMTGTAASGATGASTTGTGATGPTGGTSSTGETGASGPNDFIVGDPPDRGEGNAGSDGIPSALDAGVIAPPDDIPTNPTPIYRSPPPDLDY